MPEAQATLRPGCSVLLVDVSSGGALVQAPRPMRPGARVHLQVITPARRYAIAAQVLRCMVWTVHPADGVVYRGALKFEHRIDWCWSRAGGHVLPENERPNRAVGGNKVPETALPLAVAGQKGRK